MPRPEPIARTGQQSRDPNMMAVGRSVFEQVIAMTSLDLVAQLSLPDVRCAIYYLDTKLFFQRGGAKAARALRVEAKKRGLL